MPLDPINSGDYIYQGWDSVDGAAHFCIWARMEGVALGSPGAVVAASEKGVRDMTTAPANVTACP